MTRLPSIAILSTLFIGGLSVSQAAVIYTMDFSVAGQGSTHDTAGDAVEPSPVVGTNWELTFPAPASDGSTNEYVTVGGVMRVQDWGGAGTTTSNVINIPSSGTLEITGRGLSIGSDSYNTSNEGVTWFYSVNSGAPVTVVLDEVALGGGPINAGTDVGNTFSGVSVTAGDTLEVGFIVEVNGGGDGAEISSLTVDLTPIPEPSALALLSGFVLLGLRRRR